MTYDRKSAIIVGILFIMATGLAILGLIVIDPITGEPDVLARVPDNSVRIVLGALIIILMGMSCAAIAVMAYPILKRTHIALSIGYVAVRLTEGIIFLFAASVWLFLIPLAQAGGDYSPILADWTVGSSETLFTIGAELIFGTSALIFNYLLIRGDLLPKWISIWGFVGGALIIISGTMNLFGISIAMIEMILTLPIAINEMVLAVWLIVKGFNEAS